MSVDTAWIAISLNSASGIEHTPQVTLLAEGLLQEFAVLLKVFLEGVAILTVAIALILTLRKILRLWRKLHRITSICDTRNTASFRLMERLGMRREGHLKQSQFMKGSWQNEYIYALLHEEWIAQQSVVDKLDPLGS